MTRLIILLLALPAMLLAQTKIKSVQLTGDVISVSIDRPGDVYIALSDGIVQHFGSDGQLLGVLKSGAPDLFDPRDGARLFAFYRKSRHYEYLNPSFEVTKSTTIDSSLVSEPWLVCPSGDYNIWAIDAADNTLKKISPSTSEITTEVVLKEFPDVSGIKFMREYQGFLFIHTTANTILVFNGMGRQLKSIGAGRATYFNFIGEELYYLDEGQLNLFNLFTADSRLIKLAFPARIALVSDERLYLINKNVLEVFTPVH